MADTKFGLPYDYKSQRGHKQVGWWGERYLINHDDKIHLRLVPKLVQLYKNMNKIACTG